MSHVTYNLVWHEAQAICDEACRHDMLLQASEKPDTDKSQARPAVVELYVRYILTTNRLIECYDQIAQPQKLLIVRRLLDATLGRIVELKNDLVNIDQRDMHGLDDDILVRLGVTPMELEVKIPAYFSKYREGWQAEWRTVLDDILKRSGYIFEEEDARTPMTEIEAVRLIQTHERARQGRFRAQFMREIRSLRKKGKQEIQEESDGFAGMMAAIRIQKIWRGYVARRFTRKQKLAEMLLIGMLPPEQEETGARQRLAEICTYRRSLREQYRINYERALADTKEALVRQKTETMMQNMKEELRNWLLEYYNHSGKLPEFPSEERGGSRMMFSRIGFSKTGSESELSRSTNISSKESKSKKDKGKKGKDSADSKKKSVEESEVVEDSDKFFKPVPSNFLGAIATECEEFDEVWRSKDETNNPLQLHYIDMVVAEKTAELETELRRVVDNLMRDELQILQAALDRDRATKGKKPKKPGKARRGGKKSKKKKEKDLTPDRTLESLFEELVCNGIIRQYPAYRLADFVGERSLAVNDWGTLGDVRQLMLEYCILPLGSQVIHENTPLMRSLLIAGVEGSGKKQLVYTVCTETDAVLFDISSTNIVGKYPGKSGLTMLMHLVSKVSRLLQPSVIFIDSAEKTFMRKVPKTDKSDPKRLKKDLPKLIKGISLEDRVMLLGTSSKPWDCDQKLLVQVYQHYILLPKPNHADLVLTWKHLFQPYKILKNFDTGTMARLSDGFSIGSIIKTIKEVMTCKRMVQLRSHPLQLIELVDALSKQDPIWKEHEVALKQWLRK